MSLGIVGTNEDALGGLDSAGTSVVALEVGSLLVFVESGQDILDSVESNAGLVSDDALGLEDYS